MHTQSKNLPFLRFLHFPFHFFLGFNNFLYFYINFSWWGFFRGKIKRRLKSIALFNYSLIDFELKDKMCYNVNNGCYSLLNGFVLPEFTIFERIQITDCCCRKGSWNEEYYIQFWPVPQWTRTVPGGPGRYGTSHLLQFEQIEGEETAVLQKCWKVGG